MTTETSTETTPVNVTAEAITSTNFPTPPIFPPGLFQPQSQGTTTSNPIPPIIIPAVIQPKPPHHENVKNTTSIETDV
jgi:hypothetical protein